MTRAYVMCTCIHYLLNIGALTGYTHRVRTPVACAHAHEGQSMLLVLSSMDVIHAYALPSACIKRDYAESYLS